MMERRISKNLKPTETTIATPEGGIRLPNIIMLGMSNKEMERLVSSTRYLNVDSSAKDVIKKAPVASDCPQTLSLTALDIRTMGLHDDQSSTAEICKKALKFGNKISVEAMVKIAVEASRGNVQIEKGKSLIAVMDPVEDSEGYPLILRLEHNGNGIYELSGLCAFFDNTPCGSNYLFVISSRK
jgi:hypothetical protein